MNYVPNGTVEMSGTSRFLNVEEDDFSSLFI
jgi:hypothetical protein